MKNNEEDKLVSEDEKSILLWFFGSLAVGYYFKWAWIITFFLGVTIMPLLVPKLLFVFFGSLSEKAGTDSPLGKFFGFIALLFLALVGLAIVAMLFGTWVNPPGVGSHMR